MEKIIVTRKKLFKWSLILAGVAIFSFGIHSLIVDQLKVRLSYPLWAVYVFNLLSSIILLTFIREKIGKMDIRVGWVYLFGILVKLILFAIIFAKPIFLITDQNMGDRLSMFFPFVLFFVLETYLVTRITKLYFGD